MNKKEDFKIGQKVRINFYNGDTSGQIDGVTVVTEMLKYEGLVGTVTNIQTYYCKVTIPNKRTFVYPFSRLIPLVENLDDKLLQDSLKPRRKKFSSKELDKALEAQKYKDLNKEINSSLKSKNIEVEHLKEELKKDLDQKNREIQDVKRNQNIVCEEVSKLKKIQEASSVPKVGLIFEVLESDRVQGAYLEQGEIYQVVEVSRDNVIYTSPIDFYNTQTKNYTYYPDGWVKIKYKELTLNNVNFKAGDIIKIGDDYKYASIEEYKKGVQADEVWTGKEFLNKKVKLRSGSEGKIVRIFDDGEISLVSRDNETFYSYLSQIIKIVDEFYVKTEIDDVFIKSKSKIPTEEEIVNRYFL